MDWRHAGTPARRQAQALCRLGGVRDWKIDEADLPDLIDEADLPDLIEQLNRGQSAEVTNEDGMPLRLWINPKERSRGVEPLVKQEFLAGHQREDRRMAANVLRQHLGDLDPDDLEALACSLVRQWQKFGGCACIFLDGGSQHLFTLHELEDGHCRADAVERQGSLEPVLGALGFPVEVIPEVVTRINLGREVEFRAGMACGPGCGMIPGSGGLSPAWFMPLRQ